MKPIYYLFITIGIIILLFIIDYYYLQYRIKILQHKKDGFIFNFIEINTFLDSIILIYILNL